MALIIKLLEEYFGVPVKVELSYMNYAYDNDIIILRYFDGTLFRNSKVQPLQLEYHTDDLDSAKAKMLAFAEAYNSQFLTDGITYIKQSYGTPFVAQLFNESGVENTHIISLNGTFIITENVSDITKIEINGENIYFDTVEESYVALTDSARKIDDTLNTTVVRSGINKLVINSISQTNGLLQKLRNIKRRLGKPQDLFTVTIHYNDSDVPVVYMMSVDSFNTTYASANIPIQTVSLTE